MSNIVKARPYIAPPRALAGSQATRPGVGGAEPPASPLDIGSLNVISVDAQFGELTPLEMIERVRPYIVLAFLVAAAIVSLHLALQLRRRYIAENVSGVSSMAMDRRSIRRKAATSISEQ